MDKGAILSDKLSYKEASFCYDEALKLDPKHYYALVNKGLICQNQKNYEEAIEWFDKAIQVDGTQAFPWESKGRCLDSLNRFDQALTCYDRAIELEPKSFWAWNNKGWIYARQNKHEAALKLFDKAIEIDRTEDLPWINKGESLRKLGRIDEAVDSLKSAVGVVTARRDILLNLSSLFGDYKADDKAALDCYEQILKPNPEDVTAKAGMAEILIKLRRYRDGRASAQEVMLASKDTNLQCVAQYLVVVSYALEGANTGTEFQKLIEHFRSHSEKSVADSTNWNYSGLTNTINKSDVALETKFLLLTLIDLQLGKIDASKLSFFESPTTKVSTP